MSEHGTNSRYVQGCRCRDCTAAHTAATTAWYAEQRRLARIGRQVEAITKGNSK